MILVTANCDKKIFSGPKYQYSSTHQIKIDTILLTDNSNEHGTVSHVNSSNSLWNIDRI